MVRTKLSSMVGGLGSADVLVTHWACWTRTAQEELEVSYLSMNAVIRTDGAVKMTKPPSGKRKGELDLSSEEQTRMI